MSSKPVIPIHATPAGAIALALSIQKGICPCCFGPITTSVKRDDPNDPDSEFTDIVCARPCPPEEFMAAVELLCGEFENQPGGETVQ